VGLVSYTVVMFSCATISTGVAQHLQSISFIDNREFPGFGGVFPPGPLGYQSIASPMALSIVPNLASLLNYWLADSFLVSCLFDPAPASPVLTLLLPQLHRCYVIYASNPRVIASLCLMYLASVGTRLSPLQADGDGLD